MNSMSAASRASVSQMVLGGGGSAEVIAAFDSGGRSYGAVRSAPTRVTGPVQPPSRSANAARAPHSPAPTMIIPVGMPSPSPDVEVDGAVLDLDRVRPQIRDDRRALGQSGGVVEPPVVLRTLDDATHDEPF